MKSSSPRIAWFSPLRVRHGFSRAAYFSAQLVPELVSELRWDITAFVPAEAIASQPIVESCELQYEPFHRFASLQAANPFDSIFYHLESHTELEYSRIALGAFPGLTFFHEIIPSTHGPDPILASPWLDTAAKFLDRARPWHEYHKDYKFGDRAARRELTMSFHRIFFNERDLRYSRELTQSLPDIRALDASDQGSSERDISAPRDSMLHFPTHSIASKSTCSNITELASNSLQIALYAGVEVDFQAHLVLEALADTRRAGIGREVSLHWVVAGATGDETCPAFKAARRMTEEFSLEDNAQFYSESPAQWEQLMQSVDIALLPCFSAERTLEPFISHAIAANLPVLCSNFSATELLDYPQVVQMPLGAKTVRFLHTFLTRFAEKQICCSKGGNRPLAEEFSVEFCAQNCAALIEGQRSDFQHFMGEWQKFRASAAIEISRGAGLNNPVLSEAAAELGFCRSGVRDAL